MHLLALGAAALAVTSGGSGATNSSGQRGGAQWGSTGAASTEQSFNWVLAYKSSGPVKEGTSQGMDEETVMAAFSSCNVHYAAIRYVRSPQHPAHIVRNGRPHRSQDSGGRVLLSEASIESPFGTMCGFLTLPSTGPEGQASQLLPAHARAGKDRRPRLGQGSLRPVRRLQPLRAHGRLLALCPEGRCAEQARR